MRNKKSSDLRVRVVGETVEAEFAVLAPTGESVLVPEGLLIEIDGLPYDVTVETSYDAARRQVGATRVVLARREGGSFVQSTAIRSFALQWAIEQAIQQAGQQEIRATGEAVTVTARSGRKLKVRPSTFGPVTPRMATLLAAGRSRSLDSLNSDHHAIVAAYRRLRPNYEGKDIYAAIASEVGCKRTKVAEHLRDARRNGEIVAEHRNDRGELK